MIAFWMWSERSIYEDLWHNGDLWIAAIQCFLVVASAGLRSVKGDDALILWIFDTCGVE
jgi:hypothetical protein